MVDPKFAKKVLKALEEAYFEVLARNPAMVYQTLNDLLPRVNEILKSWGYRELSLKELEEVVDFLHDKMKYWLKGFIRHPKASGMPVIIEFRRRLFG